MSTTPAPLDLDSIRAEYDQLRPESGELADNIPPLLDELAKTRIDRNEWQEGHARALRNREQIEAEMDTRLTEAWRERDAAREELAKTERKVTTWKTRLVEETAALREELAKTRHDRDSLARRCAVRFEETQQAERERDAAREELARWQSGSTLWREYRLNSKRMEELTEAQGRLMQWAAAELGTSLIHKRIREVLGLDASVEAMAAAQAAPNDVNASGERLYVANPATTAEPADEPKATCHLPVQNGEPCGMVSCRKYGCRVAPQAEPARTYLDMPVVNCGTDVSHMAHVLKVVCRGLLPHSVPLDDEPADEPKATIRTALGDGWSNLLNDDEPQPVRNLRCPLCKTANPTWAHMVACTQKPQVEPADEPKATCGHAYIGNEGEFTCDLYAPHNGKQHWNSLAEFAWTDERAA